MLVRKRLPARIKDPRSVIDQVSAVSAGEPLGLGDGRVPERARHLVGSGSRGGRNLERPKVSLRD